jgi:hypothetical protein
MVLHVGTSSVLGSPCAGEEVDSQGTRRTVAGYIRPQLRQAATAVAWLREAQPGSWGGEAVVT